jgi:hypothetical protein
MVSPSTQTKFNYGRFVNDLEVDGSQTVAGTLAVTGGTTLSTPLTSGNVDPSLIQTADVVLTPAQIKTLYSAPTQIIAAPGAGKSIVLLDALARFTYTTPQYTGGGAVQLQYDSTVHAGGTTPLAVLPAATVNAAASSDTQLQDSSLAVVVTQNKGIYASAATADFATGTVSTLEFFVHYYIK